MKSKNPEAFYRVFFFSLVLAPSMETLQDKVLRTCRVNLTEEDCEKFTQT